MSDLNDTKENIGKVKKSLKKTKTKLIWKKK